MANNEEVKTVETPTEEVTPTEVDTTEEETIAQETEPQEVVEDEEGEIEFDESDTAEEDKSNEKKKQSREKNREYARKRREQQEKEKHSSYLKGVRTAVGDVNPYNNQKIESDEDVQTFLDMKEMEKQGLDPNDSSDYIKFIREKQKTEREQQEIQERVETKRNLELSEFKAKYPTVDIENLVNNNPKWNRLILPQIVQGKTLLEAYESVNDLIQENINAQVEQLADEKVKKQVQIQAASVGSLTDGNEPTQEAKVDINGMTEAQFKEYWKKKYGG